MILELVIAFDTTVSTPPAERRDMAEMINYHVSNVAHRIASDTAGHFGYPCTAKIRETFKRDGFDDGQAAQELRSHSARNKKLEQLLKDAKGEK